MKHYKFVLTSYGCPEQYDVWDENKNIKVAYVRYRWGYLVVHPYLTEQFETFNEWTHNKLIEQDIEWGTVIYEDNIGDGLSGILPDKKRDQILAVIDHEVYKYWNKYYDNMKEQDKDDYQPYVNLVNSGELENDI